MEMLKILSIFRLVRA